MHDQGVQVLCTEAGLGADIASLLESEEITVHILLRASLVERRQILRDMGLRYGQIMSLNRAVERRQQELEMDGEGAGDGDEEEDEEDEDGTAAAGPTEPQHTGSEAAAAKQPAAEPVPPTPAAAAAAASSRLQAASLLLRGAEVHTLRGLQVYLGNVLQHPDKMGFRTIQLANPLFQERVWSVPGGASVLRAAGFAEGARRTLRLLEDAPLEPLREAKAMIDGLLAELYPDEAAVGEAELPAELTATPTQPPPPVAKVATPAAAPPAAKVASPVAKPPSSPAAAASSATPARRSSVSGGFNAAAAAAAAVAGLATAAAAAGAAAAGVEGGGAAGAATSAAAQEGREAAVRSIEAMLEDAHTASWDAALAATTLIDSATLSAHEIRCCRGCNQGRLAALAGRVTRTLWQLTQAGPATLAEARPRARFLNALRVLTRLLPILLEDGTDAGVAHLLWTRLPSPPFPEAAAAVATVAAAGGATDHFHSLGGCLVHALLTAHFVPGFTLLEGQTAGGGGSGGGAGGGGGGGGGASAANPWATSSGTMDEARDAAIEALLACCSGVLYTPPGELKAAPNWVLLCVVHGADAQVKSLFRALLCVVFSYDPVGWGIPYAASFVPDTHLQVLYHAVQCLLVLLSQPQLPPPSLGGGGGGGDGDGGGPPPADDKVGRLLAGLQRPETLAFVVGGFGRLLRNAFASQRTYLPGSSVALDCQQELLLLLWKFVHGSRPFLLALLLSPDLPDVLMALCYCVLSWSHDVPKSSLVHLCVLTLLVLSAEPEFGRAVAAPCPHSLPLRGRAAQAASGSLADLVLAAACEVILDGHERLECVYPASLAVMANLAPHLSSGVSPASAERLVQCLGAFSRPAFLLAGSARPDCLVALLDVIDSALLYQPTSNAPLLRAVVLNAKLLQGLPKMALPEAGGVLEAEAEADVFVPTAAWMRSWQERLVASMGAITAALDVILPKLSSRNVGGEVDVNAALRATSLKGVLPAAPPVSVRRYQPNEYSSVWITQVLWGVVYSRNQHLFDARRVRLVQVVQVGQ